MWNIPSVRANDDHEAKFPEALARRVVRLLTDPGDLVLDCIVGSGTTAGAALKEGRHSIGIAVMMGRRKGSSPPADEKAPKGRQRPSRPV